MAAAKVTEAQKRAKENYNKRRGRKQRIVEFYETEHADILAHLDAQPNKSAYIRELIRRDMLACQEAQESGEAAPVVEEQPKPKPRKRPVVRREDSREAGVLFRYGNGFEDVFIEEDHCLYANAGVFGSATRHPATPYTAAAGQRPLAGLKKPVTRAYLETLEKAPADVASTIIEAEHLR